MIWYEISTRYSEKINIDFSKPLLAEWLENETTKLEIEEEKRKSRV
jgi:hypothetical protein